MHYLNTLINESITKRAQNVQHEQRNGDATNWWLRSAWSSAAIWHFCGAAIPGRLCCTVAYWVVNNRHCVLIMPVFANCAQEEVSPSSIYNNPCPGNREKQSQLHHDQNAVQMMTIARLSQAQRKRLISQNTSLQWAQTYSEKLRFKLWTALPACADIACGRWALFLYTCRLRSLRFVMFS